MLYFKHSELVDKYHVSLKTVHNWIDAAKAGKLDLELYSLDSRTYIANKPKNITLIEQLVAQGKKYKNARYGKVATPTPLFYELFSRQQILDIINSLNVYNEIPRQYNYFDEGAVNWDKFAQQMWRDDAPNLLRSSISLLHSSMKDVDLFIEGYDMVNVIDIGPGNAMPVRGLLEHLLEKGILHRYIAVDISESMLEIAEQNIKEWFGDKIQFEGYVKDVTHERFDDLIVDDMLAKTGEKTINLALLLGATPMNFLEPYDMLNVVRKSLGRDDLLFYTDKPHTETENVSFDVNADLDLEASALSPKYSFILSLLNIDESWYDVEMGFNEHKRICYIRARLKVDMTIKFKFGGVERSVVLDKGDAILLWRAWYQTSLEIISGFEKAGFTLLQSNTTKDRQYLLTISGINSKASVEV